MMPQILKCALTADAGEYGCRFEALRSSMQAPQKGEIAEMTMQTRSLRLCPDEREGVRLWMHPICLGYRGLFQRRHEPE